MKHISLDVVEKSIKYSAFRDLVTNALENDPSVLELSEDYLQYAILNQTRVKRLDKTLKVLPEVKKQLEHLHREFIWLVITESWCGDAAQILPMIHKMSECSEHISLKILFRDQNLELMDAFLTNGARAIPKLIVLDKKKLEVLASWGPRPKLAQDVVVAYKQEHGVFDSQGGAELQLWYTKDKGVEIQKEISALMQTLNK
ncbi:thioredoxin family protein [Myroides sp. LJL115]